MTDMLSGTLPAMDQSTEELGATVRQRREELGLSVRAAALRAGVTRETWSGIETGKRIRVRLHTLNAIDLALDQPAGTLARHINRQAPVRITVEIRTVAGETGSDLRAREDLAQLAGTLSVTDVYRLLRAAGDLPDRRIQESSIRAAAQAAVADAMKELSSNPQPEPARSRKAG